MTLFYYNVLGLDILEEYVIINVQKLKIENC